MSSSRVTLRDVAAAAGVSRGIARALREGSSRIVVLSIDSGDLQPA